jgi:thiol-disulfide isomerase/thioredoxin
MRQKTAAMASRLSILTLLFMAWTTPGWAVEAGDPAPAWIGRDIKGEAVSFPEVTGGKPAVLVFWATWCPYCKAFMPYLDAIQKDYAADGVQIIAINALERGRGDPIAYLESLGSPLIGILYGDHIATAYAVEFIPGLMVVDGAGRVSYRRAPTERPAGQSLAKFWDAEVREALDLIVKVD